MLRIIPVFMLMIFTLLLSGCGDKLTEETARQVLEKEVLTSEKTGRFTKIVFAKGTDGFDYFQKLIADGVFLLEKEGKLGKSYSTKPDFAHIFKNLEVGEIIDMSKATSSQLLGWGEEKALPMITICKVFVCFKKDTVQSVDEIFNDEKNGTAKVKFTIAEVGIAPYYDDLCSLLASGKSKPSMKCLLTKPYAAEIQLKKYDEGWSIDLNPS